MWYHMYYTRFWYNCSRDVNNMKQKVILQKAKRIGTIKWPDDVPWDIILPWIAGPRPAPWITFPGP